MTTRSTVDGAQLGVSRALAQIESQGRRSAERPSAFLCANPKCHNLTIGAALCCVACLVGYSPHPWNRP